MEKFLRLNLFASFIITGLLSLQIGCSSPNQDQTVSDSEVAFNDFKGYVTSTETTETSQANMTQADWNKASAEAKANYDEKVAQLDQFEGEYDEGKQEEIADLKNRFNIYWQQREMNFKTQSNLDVTESIVSTSVLNDFKTTEVATTSPENIRLAYENLVNRVQLNKDSYTKADWKIINNYYLTLDERRNAVQMELSDKDKIEISKAKVKFVALKTAAGLDPDVSITTSDVNVGGFNAEHRVGINAKNAGSKVNTQQEVEQKNK